MSDFLLLSYLHHLKNDIITTESILKYPRQPLIVCQLEHGKVMNHFALSVLFSFV